MTTLDTTTVIYSAFENPPSKAHSKIALKKNKSLKMYLVLGTWYQVLGTKYLVLGTKYLVLGTWYQVPSTWYQVLSSWYLVLGKEICQKIVSN